MTRARSEWRVGNRIAPARFLAFVGLLIIACGIAVIVGTTPGRALMIGFDTASVVFLVSLWPLLDDKTADMRRTAERNDANRSALLVLTALVMAVILVTVASELSAERVDKDRVLIIITLAAAWLFSNIAYALHYAHLFYTQDEGKDARGLDFPTGDAPDYWDFIYFAFTLGMTFQTADVAIQSRAMRRVVIGHGLAAFIFNLGVVAFTINMLGN
ncbi:DUF1345 domain-containing protein [Sphingomonas sp. ABOLG]|jgi:uncharacterized membrane protein|uniref:DUF1345 domain-containing protein n=1 Tax=Sphingomonas sp. ABOLG TaxID=1985880 RepID=UPI000F7DFF04|nr:DUF1345 domain-containing protein [Sphingomonas sp. ABOLG]RSV13897.1 DUF1345 domain-containing protein [Sphingomonas sp. ABOLG]